MPTASTRGDQHVPRTSWSSWRLSWSWRIVTEKTLLPGHPDSETQNKIAIGIPATEKNPRILSGSAAPVCGLKLSEMSTGAMEVYIERDIYRERLHPASGRKCTFERNDGLRWFEYISETLCSSLMCAAVLEQFCYRMLHVITVIRRICLFRMQQHGYRQCMIYICIYPLVNI